MAQTGVTPLTASNGGSTVNLWQATNGYMPNYPYYNQTYGGAQAPYADIGAQIRDAMQNSGLLSGAPANPFGGNNIPRYNFGRSPIGMNQVPAVPGTGQPHGLLGSAAAASIFSKYLPQVPQVGNPGTSTGTNTSAPPNGLLNPQQPATPMPGGDKGNGTAAPATPTAPVTSDPAYHQPPGGTNGQFMGEPYSPPSTMSPGALYTGNGASGWFQGTPGVYNPASGMAYEAWLAVPASQGGGKVGV